MSPPLPPPLLRSTSLLHHRPAATAWRRLLSSRYPTPPPLTSSAATSAWCRWDWPPLGQHQGAPPLGQHQGAPPTLRCLRCRRWRSWRRRRRDAMSVSICISSPLESSLQQWDGDPSWIRTSIPVVPEPRFGTAFRGHGSRPRPRILWLWPTL